ncbi:signal peptidase I [Selenomonadales bacterium OttesenSCG-928-I06]|nr:signal peptidase I [Selenomonadales bacterium OttesenSCG-928-I06]
MLKEIIDWTYSIVIAFVAALLINAFLLQPTRVQGSSMEPTLINNDYLLVSKIPHTFKQEPNYGDIVIIDSRISKSRNIVDDISEPLFTYLSITKLTTVSNRHVWVKRVIGKPNDVLEFKDGKVYRNNELLDETYTKDEEMRYRTDEKVIVEENTVFVMGDNRNNSSDSRFIGCVPYDHVLGKVIYKI